jgi:hypothetical protein
MTAVGTATGQIQEAIYQKLTNDATFMGLVQGVFDMANVPENQAFPYVTLADTTETQSDTLDTRTYDDTFLLHIWTMTRGFAQAQSILARMNVLLHRQPLSLFSQAHIGTWYLNAQQTEEPDGLTQHVAPRYRILAQESLS